MPYIITDSCTGCGACPRVCPAGAISGDKKTIHTIDAALCIECGACGRICPSASVLDQFGHTCVLIKRSQWKKPAFNNRICMSCNMCIEACPVHCLFLSEAHDRKDPHGYPYLKGEKSCIGCGICASECPVDAIIMETPQTPQTKSNKSPVDAEKEVA